MTTQWDNREKREPDPNEHRERTGDKRSKYRKFQFDATENIFTMRMVSHWTSQRDDDQLLFWGKKKCGGVHIFSLIFTCG